MKNSWFVIYVYDRDRLIRTGRIISGIDVEAAYRNRGIGSAILNLLVENSMTKKLHIQLLCIDQLKSYYEAKGFKVFAIGMKRDLD